MGSALLIARLLLAAVFLVAEVAKLVDRAGSRAALEGFGVPAAAAVPLAVALPLLLYGDRPVTGSGRAVRVDA